MPHIDYFQSTPELPVDPDFTSEFEAAIAALVPVVALTFDDTLFAIRAQQESIHHLYED